MRWVWLVMAAFWVSGCCAEKRHDEVKAARDAEELDRAVAARKAQEDAARSARPVTPPPPLSVEMAHTEQGGAMAPSKVQARLAFPAEVKAHAGCASVVLEDGGLTIHAEGCDHFEPPLTDPALFEKARSIGVTRILNHSIGKAKCAYYLASYPAQKMWKCNNAGDSWPEP